MTAYIEGNNLKEQKKEMMTCTMCGFCKSVCPAYEGTGWDPGVARGRMLLSYGLLRKDIPADDSVVESLYQCTTCKDCERRCPSKVRVVDTVEKARKDLVEAGLMLPAHKKVVDGILRNGNPYGEKLSVPETFGLEPRSADIGYFVGCTSAYRNPNQAKATMSIMSKLGEDWTLLNETCCGSVLQRVGWKDEDVIPIMERNVKAVEDQGVDTAVFSCSGCYRMFKEEYPRFVDVPFKVKHVSEYLAEKDLKLRALDKSLTYHDPCHLLAKIPGVNFKEMARNSATSRCCGGGGGVRSAYPELSAQIAAGRVAEAGSADMLVTACPFCVTNLKAGRDRLGSPIEVVDLVELVDRQLE